MIIVKKNYRDVSRFLYRGVDFQTYWQRKSYCTAIVLYLLSLYILIYCTYFYIFLVASNKYIVQVVAQSNKYFIYIYVHSIVLDKNFRYSVVLMTFISFRDFIS